MKFILGKKSETPTLTATGFALPNQEGTGTLFISLSAPNDEGSKQASKVAFPVSIGPKKVTVNALDKVNDAQEIIRLVKKAGFASTPEQIQVSGTLHIPGGDHLGYKLKNIMKINIRQVCCIRPCEQATDDSL